MQRIFFFPPVCLTKGVVLYVCMYVIFLQRIPRHFEIVLFLLKELYDIYIFTVILYTESIITKTTEVIQSLSVWWWW